MKKLLCFLVFLLSGAAHASCESFEFEAITITSETAVGFTASKYAANANYAVPDEALVSFETADVRFRVDGSSPTNTVGIKEIAGGSILLTSQSDLANFKVIGVSADGTAHANFSRGCR